MFSRTSLYFAASRQILAALSLLSSGYWMLFIWGVRRLESEVKP
jgi:hypothetical protein